MYLITYENDTKVEKVKNIKKLYEICRKLNVEALESLEENYTEDIEDMSTNRIKELLNVFTDAICVYDLKNVVKTVKESEIEEEERNAILEILKDDDIVEFNMDDFYYLPEILIDADELEF